MDTKSVLDITGKVVSSVLGGVIILILMLKSPNVKEALPGEITLGEVGRTTARTEQSVAKLIDSVDKIDRQAQDDRLSRIKLESRVEEQDRRINTLNVAFTALSGEFQTLKAEKK